jgi:hypothetical protein
MPRALFFALPAVLSALSAPAAEPSEDRPRTGEPGPAENAVQSGLDDAAEASSRPGSARP